MNLGYLGAANTELPTKTVKAGTHVSGALESAAGSSLEINYEKAATEAIATSETRSGCERK